MKTDTKQRRFAPPPFLSSVGRFCFLTFFPAVLVLFYSGVVLITESCVFDTLLADLTHPLSFPLFPLLQSLDIWCLLLRPTVSNLSAAEEPSAKWLNGSGPFPTHLRPLIETTQEEETIQPEEKSPARKPKNSSTFHDGHQQGAPTTPHDRVPPRHVPVHL